MRLEDLLDLPVEEVKVEERERYSRYSNNQLKSIVLFGAGNLSRALIAGLRERGVVPLAVSDNNVSVWGKEIEGIRIISPNEAAETLGDKAIFVVAIWNLDHSYKKTKEQLQMLGCQNVMPFQLLLWGELPNLLPRFCIDLPSQILEDKSIVLETKDLWADEQSKQVYTENILWRFYPEKHFAPEPTQGLQYQPTDIFLLNKDDVFIDGGAYDGDTIEAMMKDNQLIVKRVIAYEPDPINFEKLNAKWLNWSEDLKSQISILDKATGARPDFVKFQAEGKSSSAFSDVGTITVEVTTLDIMSKSDIPTVIKLDIEGAELEALQGASKTIREHQPIICIALYHRQKDIWQLPQYIKSLSSEYLFFLRQHYFDGFDLNCYAVPKSRCLMYKE
jgi:FkbM family methyltransferase